MAIAITSGDVHHYGGGSPLVPIAGLGALGVAGYFGLQWWRREQVKKALLAEAARLQAKGMSLEDSLTNAAAGACVIAAAAYKIPPAQAGPICNGAAIVAMKAAKLVGKGAIIAGKAIGKGAKVVGHDVKVATKAVGHAGAVVGKDIGKGAKAVAYTAPKKLIGGTVNTADKLLGKVPGAKLLGKVPGAKTVHKVVKKALCLGIFCGLDGIEDYRAGVDQALAALPRQRRNPMAAYARARPSGGNPFQRHAGAAARPVGAAGAPGVRRAALSRPGRGGRPTLDAGVVYYARLLG